jgi:microcystin-dependent protein
VAEPFLAEIRIFGFNFAPTGWALCNGQLLPISQNTALFSLIGTYYGGDGRSNFALPNLQGQSPMGTGQGPGLTIRDLGETGGEENVTLIESEMPSHGHALLGSNTAGDTPVPADAVLARATGLYQSDGGNNLVQLGPPLPGAGGNLPHNNRQPYLVVNFCIAMAGIFPARP